MHYTKPRALRSPRHRHPARHHRGEIRTIVTYPELRLSLASRRDDVETDNVLFIGRPADNEPHMEVIADLIDPAVAVVFHAMMLHPALVSELCIDRHVTPDYAPQRRQLAT